MTDKKQKSVKNRIPFLSSIQFKLILTSVGLICIGLAIILVMLAVKINNNAFQDFKENANNQLSIVENYIDDFYSKLDENINMIAAHPTIIKADDTITSYKNTKERTEMTPSKNEGLEQEIFEVFKQYAETHEGTMYVYLGTKDGGYVQWPESSISEGYNPPNEEWYQLAFDKNGEVCRTAPYEDVGNDRMITSNIRSFNDKNGNPIGTIGIDVSQSVISEMLSKMKMGDTGFSMIVHDTGVIMADGNNADNNFKKLEETGIKDIKKILTDKDLQISIDNESYIGLARKVEGTDWVLASFMSEKELKESSKNVIASVVMIGICILAAVIILMSLSIRGIIIPLKKLTVIVDDLSQGNLDAEINIKSKGEVGQLANSMNTLVSRLKTYIEYINEISFLLNEIGEGNLHLTFSQTYDGDFAMIKKALVNTTNMLNYTLSECNDAANQVASSSVQVSAGAQSLSQGATEQASSIEELSATINEISEQVKQSANNASKAKEISIQSTVAVTRGQQQMKDMVHAMEEINKTSNEISKIIKNIDDIAFQTNILALNAAVEAARAGEAGKGFAVVADEVRNLASKSAESAQSTAVLIESALIAIQNGTKIVAETAESLDEVVTESEKSADIIQNIANASEEQANSISQVNVGFEQISAVVQTNSATAEESAAASEELSGQAQILKELIGKFKLNDKQKNSMEQCFDEDVIVENADTEDSCDKY